MKKSTILTFATAAAVLATSAGTFAVWDKLDATTEAAQITMRKPAEVSVTSQLTEDASAKSETFTQLPSYTAKTTFKVADVPTAEVTNYDLKTTVEVKNGATDVNNLVTTEITDDATELNGVHNLTIKITPKDDSDAAKALANTPLDVTVKGVVTAKQGS